MRFGLHPVKSLDCRRVQDTLLSWKVKPESGYGNKTAIQPGVRD
jgi:hypothetical protein